jgi:hypothetical protein
MLTPQERRLRAQLAAHAQHAAHDPLVTTRAGRDAFLRRFEREVDPLGQLDPVERARRAEHARKSHMLGLALKSAKARRLKGAGA